MELIVWNINQTANACSRIILFSVCLISWWKAFGSCSWVKSNIAAPNPRSLGLRQLYLKYWSMKQYEFENLILAPILESLLIAQSSREKVISSYEIDRPCQNCGKKLRHKYSISWNLKSLFWRARQFAHTSKYSPQIRRWYFCISNSYRITLRSQNIGYYY